MNESRKTSEPGLICSFKLPEAAVAKITFTPKKIRINKLVSC